MAAGYCHIYAGSVSVTQSLNDLPASLSTKSYNSHPNIVQICEAASSGSNHAILFHDGQDLTHNVSHHQSFMPDLDLIPLKEFAERHRDSLFSTVYTYACCVRAS
jgi:hypothetical protein